MFLRFASRKELLKHYQSDDLTAALAGWAADQRLSPLEASSRMLADEGAIALFGREPIQGMRPHRRSIAYGFERRNGSLVRKAEEAHVVSSFFRMYEQGMSLRQIADDAHRQGIPTSRGGRWRASTVRHILRNPVYVGRVRRSHMVREGGPQGLIDPELFESVQRGLTRRAKRANGAIREPSSSPSL